MSCSYWLKKRKKKKKKELRKLLIKIFKYEKYLQNDIPAALNGLCLLYYANLHISYYLVLYVYFYSSYLLILFLLFLCCKVA